MSTVVGVSVPWHSQDSLESTAAVPGGSHNTDSAASGPPLIRLRDHSGGSAPSIYSRSRTGGGARATTTIGATSTSGSASNAGGGLDSDDGCERELLVHTASSRGSQRSGSAADVLDHRHGSRSMWGLARESRHASLRTTDGGPTFGNLASRATSGQGSASASGCESVMGGGGGGDSDRESLAAPSLFSVKFFQDNQECLLLPIQGRPNLILLFEQGYFTIRLESFYSGLAIAKLEIDGSCTKCNFRLFPGKAHTVRETRIAVGQHAIPLTFDPTEQQRIPVRCSEDIDRAVGSLRILFFHAHEEAGTLKWQWDAQDPLEVVSLDYGSLATFVRAFPAVEAALAERTRGGLRAKPLSTGKQARQLHRRAETYHNDENDDDEFNGDDRRRENNNNNSRPSYRTVTAPSRIAEAYERHVQRSQRRIAVDAAERRLGEPPVKRRARATASTAWNGHSSGAVAPLLPGAGAALAPPSSLRSRGGEWERGTVDPQQQARHGSRDDDALLLRSGAVTANPLLVLDAAAQSHRRSASASSSRNSTSPSAVAEGTNAVAVAGEEQISKRDFRNASATTTAVVQHAPHMVFVPPPHPCPECKALFEAQEARHKDVVHSLMQEIERLKSGRRGGGGGGAGELRASSDFASVAMNGRADDGRRMLRSSGGSRAGTSRSPSPYGGESDRMGSDPSVHRPSGSRRATDFASSHATKKSEAKSGDEADRFAVRARERDDGGASQTQRTGPWGGRSGVGGSGSANGATMALRPRDTSGDHVLRLAEEIVTAERMRSGGTSGSGTTSGGGSGFPFAPANGSFSFTLLSASAGGGGGAAPSPPITKQARVSSGEVLGDHRGANLQRQLLAPSKQSSSSSAVLSAGGGVGGNAWLSGSVVPPDPFVVRSC